MTVYIVELTREWTTRAWLCREHIDARIARKWFAKVVRELEQRCDDCPKADQPPAVDFVPTAAGARLPTRDEWTPPKPIGSRTQATAKKARLAGADPVQYIEAAL